MNHGIGSVIHDFFAEYFGSRFVPGLFFTFVAALTLAWAGLMLCGTSQVLAGSWAPWVPWPVLLGEWSVVPFLLLLFASYFVGHIFYRQDPKRPDKRSAVIVLKRMRREDEKKMLAFIQARKDAQDSPSPDAGQASTSPCGGAPSVDAGRAPGILLDEPRSAVQYENGHLDVQYPYLFLYEYLVGRGLKHLAGLVPWEGRKPPTHDRRSKMFINILKTRLQFFVPDKCREIARNEAHIRLMSSVWYAAWLLFSILLVAMALGAAAAFWAWRRGMPVCRPEVAGFFLWCFLLTVFVVWVKTTVEKFFHYMRVREIVNVLELVYCARKQYSYLMEGLLPDPSPNLGQGSPQAT